MQDKPLIFVSILAVVGQPIEIMQSDSETAAFVHARFGLNLLVLALILKSTDLKDFETADLMPTERRVLEKDSGRPRSCRVNNAWKSTL